MNRPATIGVTILFVIGAAAIVGAFASAGRSANPEPPPDPGPASDTGQQRSGQEAYLAARTKGSSSAPLTLYEVGDFQCAACRVFFDETLPAIQREYIETGKLQLIFINFPIVQIHPNAAAAHEFALCAAKQDRFWPIHDLLYERQAEWADLDDPSTFFFRLAETAELRRDSLAGCLASGEMRGLLMSEARSAFNAGINSTPSFVLEGGLIRGAAPIDAWRPLLDSLYAVKADGTQ